MPTPKIGLALSGGGARGFVHIGVLKVLQNEGIPIHCISGTSMGGVIAAAFACGIPISEIEQLALKFSSLRGLMKLVDLSPQRRGLLQGDRVRDFLAPIFLDRTFESTAIPLAISTVDIIQGNEIVLTQGLILPAVMATIAVPGLFPPVIIDHYKLIDGGILNNLPANRVRELGASIVIAVDAQSDPVHYHENSSPFPFPLPPFFLDFYRAELIMVKELTKLKLVDAHPEINIQPGLQSEINMFLGFPRAKEIIEVGEKSALAALPLIRSFL